MKKRHFFLAPLLGLIVFGLLIGWLAPADAVITQRQDADGGASWVNSGTDTIVPLGEHHLVIRLPDISTLSTVTIAVPFSGRIKEILFLQEGIITGASANINVWIASGATNTATADAGAGAVGHSLFRKVSPDNVVVVGLLLANNASHHIYTGTFPTGIARGVTNSSYVSRNDVIAITTDGGSTGPSETVDQGATITIVIH